MAAPSLNLEPLRDLAHRLPWVDEEATPSAAVVPAVASNGDTGEFVAPVIDEGSTTLHIERGPSREERR